MGFVCESSKKHANPFESSANPPANPLDFSPQQLRFLVRAGPTLMRIRCESWANSCESSGLLPAAISFSGTSRKSPREDCTYLQMQTACTIVAVLFFVFLWLSVKVTSATCACSVTQKNAPRRHSPCAHAPVKMYFLLGWSAQQKSSLTGLRAAVSFRRFSVIGTPQRVMRIIHAELPWLLRFMHREIYPSCCWSRLLPEVLVRSQQQASVLSR